MFTHSTFTVILFTIDKICSQSQHSSVVWMEKENVVDIQNRALFSLKEKKILSFATMWKNLEENCVDSEINHVVFSTEKYQRITLVYGILKSWTHKRRVKCSCQGLEDGERCWSKDTKFQLEKRNKPKRFII